MQARDFGIYVQTYPGDVHLASILVRSIQEVSPEIPIVIIPGDDFEYDNHPFDVPIMPTPAGFWRELGHKDRSFWAFDGPFDTFLFLDADMICVKSLDALAERALGYDGDFLLVQPWRDDAEWQSVVRDPRHPHHAAWRALVPSEVGRGPLEAFDPDHDFYAIQPFNTGAFVSRRGVIRESDLVGLHEAERKFYHEVLRKEWSWESRDLFFYDQGRMNYLVAKRSVPLHPLEPELIFRPGADALQVHLEDVKRDAYDFHLIHWMGAKSPSPSWFCEGPLFSLFASLWAAVGERTGRYAHPDYARLPECTGYSLWRGYREATQGPLRFGERVRWSLRDLRRSVRLFRRWVQLRFLRG